MTATYDLISEQVLSSNAATVTFSNIPASFKDLVIETIARDSTAADGSQDLLFQFNGDSGSNYSVTNMQGNGTTASSARRANTNLGIVVNFGRGQGSRLDYAICHVMSYANTNVFKTVLARSGNAAAGTAADVALWRSTAAITSITFIPTTGQNWVAGSTFRLFGIVG